jgi:hypothetical protein
MTWKTGDTVSLPLQLSVLATGAALTYPSLAAFTADGWSLLFRNGGAALTTPPTVTLTPDATIAGLHFATFILPAGVDTLAIVVPATYYTPANPFVLVTPNADEDSIAAQLAGAAASPVASSRINQYDWSVVDGDAFAKAMAVPTVALADFGYSDLSATGWTASGALRLASDGSSNPPAAVLDCAITTAAVSPVITASWGTFPPGLVLSAADIISGSRSYRYDIQVRRTNTFAITGVNTGAKTFTIAGDQRLWFDEAGTFTVTVSTGNNGTYTIATAGVALVGGNTVLTVTTTPPSAVADGTINDVFTLTVIRGTITVLAQVDRT